MGEIKETPRESWGHLSTIAQTEIHMKLTFTGGNSIAAIYAVTSSPLLWHTDILYKIQSFHFRDRKFDNSNRYVNTDPDTRRPICSLCSMLKAQMLTRLSIKLSQIACKRNQFIFYEINTPFHVFSFSPLHSLQRNRETTHPLVTFPEDFSRLLIRRFL